MQLSYARAAAKAQYRQDDTVRPTLTRGSANPEEPCEHTVS